MKTTPCPATPDRRWRDRRSHPLAQEREGSDGLSGALRSAHALREDLSRHEAAKLPENVRGTRKGARCAAAARRAPSQEHALRAQRAGSGPENAEVDALYKLV